jgi:pilus assembly protein CpaF
MITDDLVDVVGQALSNRDNILISGGTGTGKTTLLNAFATLLPASDRIVVIEDTAELQFAHPNLVRLEARRAQPDLHPCVIGQIASSWARCVEARHSTSSRR